MKKTAKKGSSKNKLSQDPELRNIWFPQVSKKKKFERSKKILSLLKKGPMTILFSD